MFVFYSDNLPTGTARRNYGPIPLIRPAYRNDEGLHKDEHEHFLQWLRFVLLGLAVGIILWFIVLPLGLLPWLTSDVILGVSTVITCTHPLLYNFCDGYKLKSELEAYAIQLCYNKTNRTDLPYLFSLFIARDYKLDITQPKALVLLQAEYLKLRPISVPTSVPTPVPIIVPTKATDDTNP